MHGDGPTAPPDPVVEVFAVPIEPVSTSVLLTLSEDERMRLRGMRSEAARDGFASLRGHLRRLLSERLGCSAAEVPLLAPPGCAPLVPGSGWHVSVSHASAWGLVALTRGGPVGVDIEASRPLPDALQIARTLLHPRERAWIAGHGAQASTAFLQVWVRKEAVAKASGRGLAVDLSTWSVVPAAPQLGHRADVELEDRTWHVQALDAPAGHVAAVATAWPGARAVLRSVGAPHGTGVDLRDASRRL